MYSFKIERAGAGLGSNYITVFLPPEIVTAAGIEEGDILSTENKNTEIHVILRSDLRIIKGKDRENFRRVTSVGSSGQLIFRIRCDMFEWKKLRVTIKGRAEINATIEENALVLDFAPFLKKAIPKPGFSAVPDVVTKPMGVVAKKKKGFGQIE